ncbi:hypothetical protein [Longispora urticae]
MTMQQTPGGPEQRALWLGLILLTSALVGVAAGWLTWLERPSVPGAVLAGGGALAAAILLLLSLLHFMTRRDE